MKGRARGGIITGLRKNIREVNEELKREEEGVLGREVELEGRRWKIYTVYTGDIGKTKMAINERIAERQDGCVIVGGDFNARIGDWDGWMMDEEGGTEKRRSKDKVTSGQGKLLCDWMRERGWYILNGNTKGDENGKFTYVGPRGATVIDYGITDRKGKEWVKEFRIQTRTESDHMPVTINLGTGNETERHSQRGKRRKIERTRWDEESTEEFRKKMEEYIEEGRERGDRLEEWKELKAII